MFTRVLDSVSPVRPERVSAPWIAPTVVEPKEVMCGFSRTPVAFANVNGTRSREPLRLMASEAAAGVVVPVAVVPVVPVVPVSMPVGVPVVVFVIVPVVVSTTLLGVEEVSPGVVVVVVGCPEKRPPVV